MTTALGDLRNGAKGQNLVDNLMSSTNTVEIAERGENKADPNGKYVLWNPTSVNGGPDQTGSTIRPAYIGLGHEMAHIQDIWDGTYDSSTWTTVGTKSIPNAEKKALHIENQLRSENGIPLRTHYSPGINSTQILRTGTRESLFYRNTIIINGRTYPTTPYKY